MDTLLHNVTNRSGGIPHVRDACNQTETLQAIRTTEAFLNLLIILVGGPLNAVVLVTQLLSNHVHGYSTPTIYMTNLYSTNFLTLSILPFIVLSNQHLLGTNVASCKFLSVIYYSSCTVGFATVALIAADRYRVIHRRTYARQSYRSTYVILLITWLMGLIFSTPAAVYTTVVAHDDKNDTMNASDTSNGSDTNNTNASYHTCVMYFVADEVYTVLMSWKVLLTVVWGVAPVVMMTWFYTFFYYTVRRTAQKKKSRTLTFVSVLLLSFVILQTPYVSIMIFNSYATGKWSLECQHQTLRLTVSTLSRLVPNLHCLINPILYALLGNDFLTRLRQCIRGQLFDRRAFLRSQQQHGGTTDAAGTTQLLPTSPTSGATSEHGKTSSGTKPARVKRGQTFNVPGDTPKSRPKTTCRQHGVSLGQRLSQSHHNLSLGV
ncbi:envelope glycoprotein UL33 [Panine betaherpesvirus 2]|uniref:Envelope glycoprotein UL33 n=1 Tax=Panine betaherpesvirus 2 TaxID=188763 RepID=Q8QS55_9BETA|nr:envelope glycoprotein UL33 [Panine betaherpesvirus 2]AAM00684.1 envelope glycoprotein UL33 [Panine betaherpesvirus 2]QXV67787.1 envelope glycoprotein UL33 [Panine betaherpesvirus 2]